MQREKHYYKPSEIANSLDLNVETIRRYIRDQKIRALTLPSGHYKITETDFEEFKKKCESRTEKLYDNADQLILFPDSQPTNSAAV